MLTLGKFRKLTADLGDHVEITVMGAEVASMHHSYDPDWDEVLSIDDEELEINHPFFDILYSETEQHYDN